jgi:hypothetical protein
VAAHQAGIAHGQSGSGRAQVLVLKRSGLRTDASALNLVRQSLRWQTMKMRRV